MSPLAKVCVYEFFGVSISRKCGEQVPSFANVLLDPPGTIEANIRRRISVALIEHVDAVHRRDAHREYLSSNLRSIPAMSRPHPR